MKRLPGLSACFVSGHPQCMSLVPIIQSQAFCCSRRMVPTMFRRQSQLLSSRTIKSYTMTAETTIDNPSGVTVTTSSGHTICTDLPKPMGGLNEHPQPVELLLASLAGCTQATALFVGRQMKIKILKLEIYLEAERDERGALELPIDVTPAVPSRLQKVTGIVSIKAIPQMNAEELNLLKEQTEARCPVANMMISSGTDMSNIEWKQL